GRVPKCAPPPMVASVEDQPLVDPPAHGGVDRKAEVVFRSTRHAYRIAPHALVPNPLILTNILERPLVEKPILAAHIATQKDPALRLGGAPRRGDAARG